MNIYDLDEFVGQFEQQESYNALMNEYSGTEIFKEAILFMDEAFPDWKTNNGVGTWAADFMYISLDNLAHLKNTKNKYSSLVILKSIYEELAFNYQRMKASYALAILDLIIRDFDIENEDFDFENRHLFVENYTALYKMQLDDFKKEYLKKVTFDFDF